ncbi:unnamed protein product [Tilletia controversa]|nr:unnamed protein product [Tilletia controversa]CAD6980321.1 unnamed protein product [Tilletia controversa]
MSRWGGRFAPNQENELRRLVKEPVQTWTREWVQPDPNKPFKVLKYVKTGHGIDFATQAALEAGMEGEQDDEPEQVQEVEADEGDQEQEQEQDNDDEDRDEEDEDGEQAATATAGAGAAVEGAESGVVVDGSGAAPASALPAHMQAEADAAAAVAGAGTTASASTTAATTEASSSSSISSSASSPSEPSTAGPQIDTADLLNAAAGIPATAAAALSAPILTAAATGSESVGGGGVQVASELNPPPDGVQPAAAVAAPVIVTTLDDASGVTGEGDGAGGGGGSAVPTRQEVRSVAGVATEVLIQAYTDRILVLVTQLGRVGCLIQATTSAPAHYVPSSALSSRPLLEQDDIDFSSDPFGDVPVSAYLEPPTTKSGAALPNPLPNTALLSLFGAPPAGQETLFSLYVSQIAAIVHARAGLPTPSNSRPPPPPSREEPDPRPVVIGLALRRLQSAAEDEGSGGFDEVDVLGEGERERFLEIMEMVLACRVW